MWPKAGACRVSTGRTRVKLASASRYRPAVVKGSKTARRGESEGGGRVVGRARGSLISLSSDSVEMRRAISPQTGVGFLDFGGSGLDVLRFTTRSSSSDGFFEGVMSEAPISGVG
jgi:hypothetical protein